MKVLLRILPDLLAGVGAVCIVVALWLISPVCGLTGAGVSCLTAAVLLSLFGPREWHK